MTRQDIVKRLALRTLIFVLVGGALADGASIWLAFNESPLWRVSLVLRAVSLGLFVLFYLILRERESDEQGLLNVLLSFSAVLVVMSLSLGLLFDPWFESIAYFETVIILVKFLYVFIAYRLFKVCIVGAEQLASLGRLVDWVMLTYIAFIFVGAVGNVDMLRSYGEVRPGFKGIIYAQNEATGFMLIVFSWFFMRAKTRARSWLWVGVSFLASALVATKGTLIGIPIMAACLSLATFGFKRAAIAIVAMGGLLFYASFYSYENVEFVSHQVDQLVSYLVYHYENDVTGSVLTVMTSGRDTKVSELMSFCWDRSSWVFLIGGAPIGGYASESDLVDLVAVFGIPFTLVFLVAYLKLLVAPLENSPAWVKRFMWAFTVTWMLVAIIAGHLMNSGMCGFYLALLVIFLQRAQEFEVGAGEEPAVLPGTPALRQAA